MTSMIDKKVMFELNMGSDANLTVNIDDDNGDIDLTGREVSIFAVDNNSFADRVSAEITDAGNGEITIFIEGTDPIPIGYYRFRLQIIGVDSDSIGLPPFVVRII